MKLALIALAAATLLAPAAMAQVGSSTNTAVVGIQSNTVYGAHNDARNIVDIKQHADVSSRPGFFGPTLATGANDASVGYQGNTIVGRRNDAVNFTGVDQSADAKARPFGAAGASNKALVVIQQNDLHGYDNYGENSTSITQTAESKSGVQPSFGFGMPLIRR